MRHVYRLHYFVFIRWISKCEAYVVGIHDEKKTL